MDAMSSLLARFRVDVRTFFSGPLCKSTSEYGHAGPGHLHIVHQGQLKLEVRGEPQGVITGPAVILFPRPVPHRLIYADDPARISCAQLDAGTFESHPLMRVLSEVNVHDGPIQGEMSSLLEWLVRESEATRPGSRAVMDRLFELVLIGLLRQWIACAHTHPNLLQGLAHPGLARALAAMHEHPERRWTLSGLAAEAYMSRSSFADTFHRLLGCTPLAYLRQWRIGLLQQGLRNGLTLPSLAEQVGYEDTSALRRAFRKAVGCAPREWLRTQGLNDR